jgi:N-acetylneuraminic acid mutarotase
MFCCLFLLASSMTIADERQYTLHQSEERIENSEARNSPFTLHSSPFSTPAWTRFAAPPADSARWSQACCYDPANDKFYMMGGTPTGDSVNSYVNLCQCYDPNTDAWTAMAHMPNPKGWIKGLYARGKIYVIGGQSNMNSALSDNAVFDPTADTWVQKIPNPIPTIAYVGAVYRESLLYVMGGTADGTSGMKYVQIYNVLANTWTSGTPLLTPCDMGDACIVGDTIYFAGGYNRSVPVVDSMMRKGAIDPTDPTRITWSWGPLLPAPRGDGPTVDLNSKVYWIAGDGKLGGHSSTQKAYVYAPGDTTIRPIPSYPHATTECCWAASRSPIPQIFGFCGYASPDTGYYMLDIRSVHDVGATQFIWPSSGVVAGDSVSPAAAVQNFGAFGEQFSVMMRIGDEYTAYESLTVPAGGETVVTFPVWQPHSPGALSVKCSTLLAGDMVNEDDALTGAIVVNATHVSIVSVFPGEQVYPGIAVPAMEVRNYGSATLDFEADAGILYDDTFPFYHSTVSVTLAADSTAIVPFDAWNATDGDYLAWITVENDYDTFRWHIAVSESVGWTSWTPGPGVGSYCEAAGVGSRVYAVGGRSDSIQLAGLFGNELPSRTWQSLASMPQGGVSDGAAAVIGDTLYLHGGYSYGTQKLVDRLFKYSISANAWTSDTGCCPYNWHPCMVALNGRLYYLGGSPEPYDVDSPSVQTWCYTPGDSPPWARKADMNAARVYAHAVVYDGVIYLAGGAIADANGIRTTEFYNPATDVWTRDSTRFPYLPEPRWSGAAGCAGTTMFIYGGASNGVSVDSVLEYNFLYPGWTKSPGIPGHYASQSLTGAANSLGIAMVFGIPVDSEPVVAIKEYALTGIKESEPVRPSSPGLFALDPARPNPFVDHTSISCTLPRATNINLRLYDIAGRCVAILAQGPLSAGRHVLLIRNSDLGIGHSRLASGVYLCRLEAGEYRAVRKLLILNR